MRSLKLSEVGAIPSDVPVVYTCHRNTRCQITSVSKHEPFMNMVGLYEELQLTSKLGR